MNSNRHAIIFTILDKAHPGNHGMDIARWGELVHIAGQSQRLEVCMSNNEGGV